MKPMVEGNPEVGIQVFYLDHGRKDVGKVMTTYKELDDSGNHDGDDIVLEDNPDFAIPSSVAFVIWAQINGGHADGCVTSVAEDIWHAYDWKVA